MDYDVQGDETTEPTIETHCPECGAEWTVCKCPTWSNPNDDEWKPEIDDEWELDIEYPW